MAKKKTSRRTRRPPAPKVFRRLTDSLLLGYIRSAGQLYAAPHNIHPNSNQDVAMLLDIADFRDMLNSIEDEAGRTVEDGQDHWVRFAVCSLGRKTDEEAILDLMRGYYQADRQLKCRVHFYVRDLEKEHEISQWGNQ